MKKHIYNVVLSLFAAVMMVGCQEVYTPVDNMPVLETAPTENLGATQVTLHGVIVEEAYSHLHGDFEREHTPHYFFLLSEHEDLSDSTRVKAVRSSYADSDSCYAHVSGLAPSTTYYYALCVANEYSMVKGEVQSFTTGEKSIEFVFPNPVEDCFVNTATLTGTFIAETQCSATFTLSEYEHFPDTASHTYEATVLKDSCYVVVDDLKPATTYYYKLSVTDKYTTVTETGYEFTTYAVPVITANPVEEYTHKSATLTGTFVGNGVDYEELCFKYSKNINFPENNTFTLAVERDGNHCSSTGDDRFDMGATYYYKLCVTFIVNGSKQTFESEVQSFKTKDVSTERIVDLGLSVKWAGYNVGSSRPEDIGLLYAWGETASKNEYSTSTYQYHRNGSYVDIGSNICGTQYDVAHMSWGNDWRMPTTTEMEELCTKCSWEYIMYKGICGWLVTGPNGNMLFFPTPTSGYSCHYWSGTLYDNSAANGLYMNFEFWAAGRPYDREYGGYIRPVRGTVEPTPESVIADAVDLGLSVKWASHNVGATAPEEYGSYYAWGETKDKNYYNWPTYGWANGSYYDVTLTKYCNNSDLGVVDNKKNLDLEDDVAHVKWGQSWRMPTSEEFEELYNKCLWEWTTVNGVNGYRVMGPNGNVIFLPAAGNRYDTPYADDWGSVHDYGISGRYWTNTLDVSYCESAAYLIFSKNYKSINGLERDAGLTVRPVTE